MNELKYRKGIVFFIDILGSQQRTQDSSKIQESYFIANTFITEMENVQKRHRNTSIVDRAVFSFSDCAYIIYSLKQGYESEESEIKMIYQSLYNTQQTLCDFIYNGFLCRGGITFGDLYMDLSRNMVFGPAITKAFKLENQANDPNIIFDDELAQRIITFDEKIKKENDEAALLNGEIIKLNHNSRKYFLNYLNYFFNIGTAQLGSNSVSFEEFYTTVIDNIQKELKKISVTGISKDFAKLLYKKITENTEKLYQDFNYNYRIEFNNIKSIHLKLVQLCKSLGFNEGSCSINVRYIDESADNFNTFDKFEKSYTDKPNQTLQVIYKYSMMKPPVVDSDGNMIEKVEDYKVTVVMRNLRALSTKEEMPLMFIKSVHYNPIHTEIEYVDYPIASTIISNIIDWTNTIPHEEDNKYLKFLQKIDRYFFRLGKCLFVVIPVFIFLIKFDKTITNLTLLKYSLGIFAFLICFMEIGKYFGSKIEDYIDRIQNSTRILLTTADINYENTLSKRNKKNIWASILNFIFSIIVDIGVSIIATFLCTKF